jgi:hypothetical protein
MAHLHHVVAVDLDHVDLGSPFNSLPCEALFHMMEFMSVQDVMQLSQVNRSWLSVVNSNECFWKRALEQRQRSSCVPSSTLRAYESEHFRDVSGTLAKEMRDRVLDHKGQTHHCCAKGALLYHAWSLACFNNLVERKLKPEAERKCQQKLEKEIDETLYEMNEGHQIFVIYLILRVTFIMLIILPPAAGMTIYMDKWFPHASWIFVLSPIIIAGVLAAMLVVIITKLYYRRQSRIEDKLVLYILPDTHALITQRNQYHEMLHKRNKEDFDQMMSQLIHNYQ